MTTAAVQTIWADLIAASFNYDGDYVITLGCGNVYQIIPQVLAALARTTPAEPGE